MVYKHRVFVTVKISASMYRYAVNTDSYCFTSYLILYLNFYVHRHIDILLAIFEHKTCGKKA